MTLQLALLLVMMLLASVTTFHVSRRWYVPLALVWTLAFLLFGRLIGLTWSQLGLSNWLPGFIWGSAAIAVVSLAMTLGVAIPRLRSLFADERVISASRKQVARKSLIEIPLGTVLMEEVVFRSVLLGLLTSIAASRGIAAAEIAGVAGSALLFGCWHVLPALEMHDAHSLTSQFGASWRARAGTVIATIFATASAGVLFGLVLLWSGSLLAPIGLHWATNATGSVAAWLVGRRQ